MPGAYSWLPAPWVSADRPGCGLQRKVGFDWTWRTLVLGPPFIWAGAAEVQCGATRGTCGVRRPMIRLGGPKTDGMTFGLRRIAPPRRCPLRRVAYYFAPVP